MSTHTKQLGREGERLAAEYLVQHGYQLLAQNWHASRHGELDIVAQPPNEESKNTLAIVEVKTRNMPYQYHASGLGIDAALENMTPQKQQQLTLLATLYLQEHPQYTTYNLRFDVITILTNPSPDHTPTITHYKHVIH